MPLLHPLMHPWVLIVVGLVSVARMARLLTYDDFPPLEWARPRVAAKLGRWAKLAVCPFCLTPYLMAAQMLWFWLLWGHGEAFAYGWLLPNLWWALSYLSAVVVAYDQPDA